MADFRWDPVTGQWVIIASNRAQRPNDFRTIVNRPQIDDCPFCYGNESLTPREIAVYQSGQRDGRWTTRVFANKYPAVGENAGFNLESNVGPYRQGNFVGHHEVIVESPEHKTTFSQLDDQESDCALKAYRDRIAEFAKNARLKHAMLFKNCRPEAGSSIEHLHSQILCTSVTTEKVMRRISRARQYFESNRQDVISSIVDFEMGEEVRIVDESPHFVAFCPFASRFAFQTSIVPKSFGDVFHKITDQEACELGRFIRNIVVKLETALHEPAYNLLLHIAPFDVRAEDYYRWHVELFPRLANPAGYEWGTGCWINSVAPEFAAAEMRKT